MNRIDALELATNYIDTSIKDELEMLRAGLMSVSVFPQTEAHIAEMREANKILNQMLEEERSKEQ